MKILQGRWWVGFVCSITFLAQNLVAQDWLLTGAPQKDWFSLVASADGIKLAAIAHGDGIYTSTNSGYTWARATTPTANWSSLATSTDGKKLVAVSVNGPICISTNAGGTWTVAGAPTNNWTAVTSSADGSLLTATVKGGAIYHSTNSGGNWSATSAPNLLWRCVASSADGTKLLAGSSEYIDYQTFTAGPVYLSTNSGSTWNPTTLPVGYWSTVAASSDGTKMVAQSSSPYAGNIYISTNSGATWFLNPEPGDFPPYWESLALSANGTTLLAGSSGLLLVSTNLGSSWFLAGVPVGLDWPAVALSADGTEMIGGISVGGMYVLNNVYPFITSTPDSVTNTYGGNDWLSVTATGAAPLTYQWQKNGTNLVDGGSVSGATTPDLHINGISQNDVGGYTCVVSNSAGSVTSVVASVAVIEPVIFQQPDSNPVGITTATTSFTVIAGGTSTLHYQWRRNGTNLTDIGRISGTATSNLLVNALVASDAANYDVVITNLSGSVTSSVSTLTINDLGILVQPTSQEKIVTSTTTLSVVAAGTPALTYQWQKDGNDIANSSRISGATGSNLVIQGSTFADSGAYTVVVSNASGTVTSDPATLQVESWRSRNAPQENWGSIASSSDGSRLAAVVSSREGPYENHVGAPIYTSSDYGATWVLTSVPTNLWVGIASSADGNKLFAANNGLEVYQLNNGGEIYVSTNAGVNWTRSSVATNAWNAIACSADGTKVYAVSGGLYPDYQSYIYTSTNSGVDWTQTAAPLQNWRSVASSADGSKLVAVGGQNIFTSTDSGSTWTQTSAPKISWGTVASSADGNKLAATIYGDGIYTSTDAGTNWTQSSAPLDQWNGIASSADGTKLMAIKLIGTISMSTDSGTNWSDVGSPSWYWNGIAASADGSRFAASGYIMIYTWPAVPTLHLTANSSQLVFTWPIGDNQYALYRNANLSSTNWVAVTNQPIIFNGVNQVTVSSGAGTNFYRLISQ